MAYACALFPMLGPSAPGEDTGAFQAFNAPSNSPAPTSHHTILLSVQHLCPGPLHMLTPSNTLLPFTPIHPSIDQCKYSYFGINNNCKYLSQQTLCNRLLGVILLKPPQTL